MEKLSNYSIRDLKPDEVYILEDMLYEAIFQKDENNLLAKEVINHPELKVYIDNWGQPDDRCLVAEIHGKIVGAVWTRILDGKVKGYGNVDNQTPEFAISLFREYRNQGIGTALMQEMIDILRKYRYTQVSLSVAKNNYAFRMYRKLGFEIIKEKDEDYLMILKLPCGDEG